MSMVLVTTSWYCTDSQWPHRCCNLATNAVFIDRRQACAAALQRKLIIPSIYAAAKPWYAHVCPQNLPKVLLSAGNPGRYLTHYFMGHPSPQRKRGLHRCSCFSAAHSRDQQTDRQTTLYNGNNRPRITLRIAMRCSNDSNGYQLSCVYFVL